MPAPQSLPDRLDLLVTAGVVHTMDPERPQASAVGIADGRVVWIGQAGEADGLSASQVIDVPEGCVTPGLVDAHIHPIMGLDITRGVDLSEISTLPELQHVLTQEAADGADAWILGWGLDPSIASGRNLGTDDLDAAVAGRPVFIRLFDGHSAVVNSRAVERAGLTGQETFASAAEVETDDGMVTGFLKEWEAMGLVLRHIPAPPHEERLAAFLEVLESMADSGLTGGQVLDWSEGMFDLVRSVEARGELPIRLSFAPWLMPADPEDRVTEAIALQGESGRRWCVDGIKLMIDGTIDNGTAWLARPDVNGQSTGPLWLDPAAFTQVLHRLDGEGVRTTTHAIGDEAVAYVLEAIATAPSRVGPTGAGRTGHRVEHIETIPDDLVGRFAELDVAASMQPTHCTLYCSADRSDNWSRRLGDERAEQAWRLGSLRRAGVTVAVGSDWPIAPFHPLRIMADGQLRREAGRLEQLPVAPGEALTAVQMLEGYATHRARSWGQADGGMIRVGDVADLSVFGADVLRAAPDELPEIEVIATVVQGTVRTPRPR